ncbi:MAG TPA: trypsin-like serine protease [Gemmatimonadales bacterium]|nr:trypsin-like serine protease [Gemmatimonadales bacterium]
MRARILIPTLAAFCGGLLGCDRALTNLPGPDRPSFITYGSLDGNTHPAVVLIVMDIAGEPAFRCSGTVIAPKVVLTAGHCAGEPGEFSGMRVFTESDVENGNNNYPFAGPNTIEAKEWHSHPLFTEAQFFRHDVGVLVLSREVKLSASDYGKLPRVNQLDALQPSSSTLFTAVGYGLQKINPVFIEAEKVRMFAEPWLVQINTPGFTGDFSLLLSNNASSGGTCFGDSGGPNYVGSSNVVAGVTSFGLNGTCGGTGGVFRLDRKNVLDFVSQYLN